MNLPFQSERRPPKQRSPQGVQARPPAQSPKHSDLNEETRSYLLVGPLTLGATALTLPFAATGTATIALALLLIAVSVWYIICEARLFGGLTFTSSFVGISAFVFGFRALYIGFNDDFSIITILGLTGSQSVIIESMRYVIYGAVAYIGGACLMTKKVMREKYMRQQRGVTRIGAVNLATTFLYSQIVLTIVLVGYSSVGSRSSIYEIYDSAYIYLLPTLVHGFDLYFFVHILAQWWKGRNPLNAVALGLCGAMVLGHAYFLSNMSTFRSYYLAGIFVCGAAVILVMRGRVGAWVLAIMLAFYPLFKAIGVDRDLNNAELMTEVVMKPLQAYSGYGMEAAFGTSTDINMLDTFAASLNWEHAYRGYVLSYVYPLVHWIPRAWWPSKPVGGVLSDTGYVYVSGLERAIPYSPGLIGFFNDDGGKAYMILMMFVLGIFMRYWEILAMRQRSYEMYVVVWAALLLSSVIAVRYLPYQIFYQFLTLFGPCWICDRFIIKQEVAQRR